jgi:ubiquinone/menaquinone biosynthesis C-methylase UbiE
VLNMVCDDARAIREISRILKPGGTAVLPVPVSKATTNIREVDPKSEECERLAMFGDSSMYRAYTMDEYSKRLSKAGLLSTVFTETDISVDGSNRWMVADESIQIARHLSADVIVVPA